MTQKRMYDVLWIEDDARTDTTRYIPPVKQTFQYRLSIARDLSEAVHFLIDEKKKYDAVIVDMRLPIGADKRLQKIAPHTPGYARIDHKHGIEMLYILLGSDRAKVKLPKPAWITVEHIGVFTIDRYLDIEEPLKLLSIPQNHYRQKGTRVGATTLLDLIKFITEPQNGTP